MQAAQRLRIWGVLARRHPSAFLLAAQLLSLLVHPLMDQSLAGRWLFGAVALVVVPLALWVVGRSPLVNWIAWLLAVPAILLTLAGVASGQQDLLVASALLEACLYFYAAGGLIVYMLRDHHVSNDELFAAGATFTLLAWGFAYAYYVCQAWYPGSFTGFEPNRPRRWLELLFLSFTTLSGVGLGDVLPVGAQARALVMLEMLTGVGYLAMVVSRLIGLATLRGAR